MKWLCLSLFLILSNVSIGQEKDSIPSGLGIRLISSLQNEDIYTFLSFEMWYFQRCFVDVGFGYGWRRGGQSLDQGFAAQSGIYFDLIKPKNVFFGPSFRYSMSASGAGQHDLFVNNNFELGYNFSFGRKLKIVQASYLGLHNMEYRSNSGKHPSVNYLGYSFQLGLAYEI